MKGKITLVVLILLVMSYVPVIPDVTSQISPNIYYLTTPTIVNGTSILDLSNGIYYLEESITLEDDATLTIRDATLYFTSDSRTIIIANDNSQITIERSQISHESGYSYINIHDMSHLTLSTSILLDVYIRYYDSSRGVILDSVTTSDVSLYDSSYMSMQNASIPSFYLYDLSNASITQSIIYNFLYLEFEADIQVTLNTISVGQIEYLNLFKLNVSDTLINSWRIVVSGTSEVTLTNSNIEYLYAYSQSKLNIDDSTLRYLYVFDYSDVSLTDSNVTGAVYLEFEQDSDLDLTGLRPGTIDSWNLVESGSVSYCNLVIQNSDVSSWHVYVRGDSVVSFSDSELGYVYAYDDSVVSVFSSTIQGIYSYGFSGTTFMDSILDYMYVYDSAKLVIIDSTVRYGTTLEFEFDSKLNTALPIGSISQWNLESVTTNSRINLVITNSQLEGKWTIYGRHIADVAITNSQMDYVYTYDSSSILLMNSTIRTAYSYDVSRFTMTNSIMDNTLFSYESSIIQVFDSYVNKLRSYKTSSVVLYNCTSFEVTVYDSSKIKVGWYILITIRDADEGPISGVKVKISDATQVELYDLFTDSEGIVKTILWEKTIYTNDVIKYGNYTLRITNGDLVDEFIQISIKNNVDTTYIYKRINPLSNLFGLPRYLGIILIMICVAAIIIIFLVSRNRSVTWS
jgi:hypothetical protein